MSLIEFFDYIKNFVMTGGIGIVDVIDICIISVIIFYMIKFIRDRRASKLLIGVGFLVVFYFVSSMLEMNAINFILRNVFQVGIIAIMIVFQPELRSVLENMGSTSLSPINRIVEQKDSAKTLAMIDVVSQVAADFSLSKTGALIVIERTTKIGDIENTGTPLKAEITNKLLKTIFFDKTPLHDGAVIISGNLISSAGCFLPLSNNNEQLFNVGTRHRAGLGVSEVCDAAVVIVSEETGIISLALNGKLRKNFTKETLTETLAELLVDSQNSKKANIKKSKQSEEDAINRR